MTHLARTRSLACCSLLALAAALGGGCADDTLWNIIDAEAELTPIGDSGVGGRFQISHDREFTNARGALGDLLVLPDDTIRRLAIYDAADCGVDQATARVFDPPPVSSPLDGDLGEIQHRGDETGFVSQLSPGVGQTGTTIGPFSYLGEMTVTPGDAGYVIGKIVVVRAADRADGAPGAWQACGVLAAVHLER